MNDTCIKSARRIADQLLYAGPAGLAPLSSIFVQVRSSDDSAQLFSNLVPILDDAGVEVIVTDAASMSAYHGLSNLASQLNQRQGSHASGTVQTSGLSFADVLWESMRLQPRTIALLIGGAEILQTEVDEATLKAIKSASDSVNILSSGIERFVVVAAWSLPDDPKLYICNSHSAFYGATVIDLAMS